MGPVLYTVYSWYVWGSRLGAYRKTLEMFALTCDGDLPSVLSPEAAKLLDSCLAECVDSCRATVTFLSMWLHARSG